MDISDYLESFIEAIEKPVVICDMDCNIIYINNMAKNRRGVLGEKYTECTNIKPFLKEEAATKLDMILEWFKEDENNNCVFSKHDEKNNTDIYIIALRDKNKKLIGFSSKYLPRTPEKGKEYDIN